MPVDLMCCTGCALQIFQDISEAYARKTATVARFPHSNVRALGIHPCKHASTMHKLSELSEDGGGRPLDAEQCVCYCETSCQSL